MNEQDHLNYQRIAEAIAYLSQNFRQQPGLEEVAGHVHMSPFHFQRVFTEWAGTSPKKFLQYISLNHAKKMLKENQSTLFDASFDTGLSGTGRLHDLFITLEGMTPAEFKHGGKNLSINYDIADSPFGNILVASTTKGICFMAFREPGDQALTPLNELFPNAEFIQQSDAFHQNALSIFRQGQTKPDHVRLHIKGTRFQIKVWEALLQIPMGQLSTYGTIATKIGHTNACRAVGTAIGRNPVAYLIPCHRVIQSTGVFGGYMWGQPRKTAIIGWEAAKSTDG